jgi:formylglycine-generating enzyme required for sulfatase activity
MICRGSLRAPAVVIVALAFAPQPAVSQPPQNAKAVQTQHPKSFRDCPQCPKMVKIPSGTFLMGAGTTDTKSFVEEKPQHRVSIKSFSISSFDITRGEWKTFMAATSRTTSKGCDYSGLPKDQQSEASWQHLGFPQDDRHPVVCVTFQDALDYTAWLTKKTGHEYRLPTEAEWEYAARAGTTTPFPWGTAPSHEFANYGGEEHPGPGVAKGRDQWVATSPVGSFPPNAFGLYDTNGNVMQWVRDCFSPNYATAPADGSATLTDAPIANITGDLSDLNGTRSCAYRMLRGGDWGDPPTMIRSAYRNFAPPPGQTLEKYRSSGLGIRIARK